MSSFLQNYCDVTESLAFKSSQIHSSSSSESINLNIPKPSKLKCFNCFGNNNKTQYCSHCGGTAYVTDSHPLALLFGDILCQKLDVKLINEPVWTDFDNVETIKEEEEELDERKIICDLCNIQCDVNYKYYCQCCECFFVCVTCADEKGDDIDHQHPLATNKYIQTPNLTLKRTDSTNVVSHKNSPTKQQNQDYFNINDIISQDFRIQFQKLVKIHMSDQIQFDDYDVGGSIASNKSSNFDRETLNKSQEPKGLFGEKQMERKEHFWQVNEDGKLTRVQPFTNGLQVFFEQLNSTSSRIMGRPSISVRDSIEFNIFEAEQMVMSTGPRQSFGFGLQSNVLQLCNHCGTELKDIYSLCRTCQRSKLNFKFCCECQDKKAHTHDRSHEIETVLGNVLGRMEEMVSESVIQSEDEDQDFVSMKMSKKKSSLEKRPPRLPQSPSFEDDLSGKKSFCKLKCGQSFDLNHLIQNNKPQIKVNNFGDESVINLEVEDLYNSAQLDMSKQIGNIKLLHKKSSLLDVNNSIQDLPDLSRFNDKKQQKPRVCFVQTLYKDDEDIPIQYVDSDSDSKEDSEECTSPNFINIKKPLYRAINYPSHKSIKSMKQIQHTRKQQKTIITSSSREIVSSISYSRSSMRVSQRQYQSNICERQQKRSLNPLNQVEEFIFHQYSCDQCGCNPIKNVRYHCLECEDYDLCEDCFDSDIELKHAHDFERIDGLKKMQQQRALLLQRKDLNKGRQSLVRNSHSSIGMLAKTKKTVQMMKKGVNQLNNSVMNLTRSFGNYGQILGQRMSLRQRVQS